MTNTVLLVFGGPTTPERADEVRRWYDQHLQQMCSLPGVTRGHLYRPSDTQLPRTKAKLPPTLGIYELDTVDHAGAVDALVAAHQEGAKSGVYEPGRSIPGPPEGAFAADESYQSAFYNLVSRCPRGQEWSLTGKTIFMVFGGPTKPALEEEIMRWYVDSHLEEVCSLPGIVSGQFLRPSSAQLPGSATRLPEVLALFEYDTEDLAGSMQKGWAAHLEGMKTGAYVPGRSIPGPVEGIWALNPQHQSVYYDLVARWPQ